MKRVLVFFKKNHLSIISIVSLLIVMAIAEDVFESEIMSCDTIAYNLFINCFRNDILTSIMKIITNFGSILVLIIFCALLFIFIKIKKIGMCVTTNLIVITCLNQIIKFLVQRPRPNGYELIIESGYSFPSGHSMISLAFYGFLIYLICKCIKNKTIKIIVSIILSILIILIGISRIYLGVHYASDVIAGALLSVIYLIIYIKAVNKFIFKKGQ